MESATSTMSESQKRRSARIVQAVPLTVSGVDALGRPFLERTSTLILNCHGCRYQSKHYVLKNMWVTLEVPHPDAGREPRAARARVMWIQRPRTVRELFQVGVELETPGNLWGIAFSPPDWFPFPETASAEIPLPSAIGEFRELSSEPAQEKWAHAPAAAHVEDNLRTMPPAGPAEPLLEWQMTRLVNEAREQLHAAARESAAEAVSAETRPLLAALHGQMQDQIKEAAERSVNAAAGNAVEQALRGVLALAEQDNEARVQAARERWDRELNAGIEQAGVRLSDHFGAIAGERSAAFENQLEIRLRGAIENADGAVGNVASQLAEAQKNLERMDGQARDTAASVLQEVEQQIRAKADGAVGNVASQLAEAQKNLERMDGQARDTAASILQEVEQQIRAKADGAVGNVASQLAEAQKNLERMDGQARDTAASILQEVEQQIQTKADRARAQVAELDAAASRVNDQVAAVAATAQSGWQARLDADVAAATDRWNQHVETSFAGAAQLAAERIERNSQEAAQHVESEMGARIASWGSAFTESRAAAEIELERLRASLAGETARTREALGQIQSAAQGMEEWPARVAQLTETAQQELERRAAALVEAQSRELAGRAEQGVVAWTDRLQPALEAAGQQTVERLVAEVEQQLHSRLEHAGRALEDLERGTRASEDALRAHHDAVSKVSEREMETALGRLGESMGRLERDFEESGRAVAARWLGEIETKANETTHNTFESLFKTADWYEKKVQNHVQLALDKGVELASAALREKAGEISSLFAAELDHYSRNYVEHTQGQLEESGRDMLERVSKQSAEMAAISAESLAQQVRHRNEAALAEFHSKSSSALDYLTAQMQARVAQVRATLDTEGRQFSSEFRASLALLAQQAVGGAQQELSSHVAAANDSLRSTGDLLERHLRETTVVLSDSAVNDYKQRLESASNSWLLTTVTKLTQQSEQQIESVARSTEERLREACNHVFAGLGETLHRRMLDVFGPPDRAISATESK